MPDNDDELGVYFKCLSGANAHFALVEPNSFSLMDSTGRDWVCYPVPPQVVRELDMLSDLVEIDAADTKSGDVTDVRLVFCKAASDLHEKLAESPR